ncbi:MAG: BlaI/MecI/CopY family transcriptional regulator [Pirellulales bacterium]
MPDPEGDLTPAQFEILQLLWKAKEGLTVAEIWEATCAQREVGRTTTLNLVDRLEKRGWLRREKVDGVFRYQAAVDQESTKAHMASDFVGNFFGGSPSQFILSLLGTQKVSKAELERLKSMLEGQAATPKKRKGE